VFVVPAVITPMNAQRDRIRTTWGDDDHRLAGTGGDRQPEAMTIFSKAPGENCLARTKPDAVVAFSVAPEIV